MAQDALLTAEEFFTLGDRGPSELVRGNVMTMSPAGGKHGQVAATVLFLLRSHVGPKRLGLVSAAETGFLIARSPDTVRAPDTAFVSAGRVPADGPPESYWPFAPDLAVEVVSPGDRWVDVEEKVRGWLEAGSRLVWVLDPRSHTVHVHHPTGPVALLGRSDVLSGEDVIPGFSTPVAELFA